MLGRVFIILGLLSGCTHGRVAGETQADGSVVKSASPGRDKPRAFDCAGENQSTDGNTRKDCLPNKGDEAARDTIQGAGGSGY